MNFHLPIHNLTPPPDQVKVNTGLGPRHFKLKSFSNSFFPKLYWIIEPSIFSIVNSMLDMPTILTWCERNSMTTGGATSDVNFSTPNFDVFVFTKVFTTCRETEK